MSAWSAPGAGASNSACAASKPPARALLLDDRYGSPLDRGRAAAALAPALPAAHVAAAEAAWHEGDFLDAGRAWVAGAWAAPQHLEASAWLRASGLRALCVALGLGGLWFLLLNSLVVAPRWIRGLGAFHQDLPTPSRAALVGALVLLPAAFGEGLFGLALGLVFIGAATGSAMRRVCVALASVCIVASIHPLARSWGTGAGGARRGPRGGGGVGDRERAAVGVRDGAHRARRGDGPARRARDGSAQPTRGRLRDGARALLAPRRSRCHCGSAQQRRQRLHAPRSRAGGDRDVRDRLAGRRLRGGPVQPLPGLRPRCAARPAGPRAGGSPGGRRRRNPAPLGHLRRHRPRPRGRHAVDRGDGAAASARCARRERTRRRRAGSRRAGATRAGCADGCARVPRGRRARDRRGLRVAASRWLGRRRVFGASRD